MSISEAQVAAPQVEERRTKNPWYVTTATLARRQPVGTLGAGMILFMVLTAAFADVLSPFNPVDARFSWMLQAPDAEHRLGTDQFGRHFPTPLIYGARTALFLCNV